MFRRFLRHLQEELFCVCSKLMLHFVICECLNLLLHFVIIYEKWKASRYLSESVYCLQRTQFLPSVMTKMLTLCRETAVRIV
jgi:hypothetical protein